MKNRFYHFLTAFTVIAVLGSCTDLEIEETDSIISEDRFDGVADVQGAVTNLSNIIAGGQLGNQEGLFALNEVSTDEYIVPTRGTDWGDNGRWLSMHRHTWNAELSDIVNAWQQLNSIVFNASRAIDAKSVETTSGDVNELKAQARFYRAWAMHWILDMWRQVPFRDINLPNTEIPIALTPQAALDTITADLNVALQVLPAVTAGDDINRKSSPTKAAANLLLARVHLNKHVYLDSSPNSADMQLVIDAVDAIEADGYTLAAPGDFFDIFRPSNDVETIWWTQSDAGPRIWHTLHYNLNSPGNAGGGWNGFSTLAEFYDLFEGDTEENYGAEGNPLNNQEERRGWVPNAETANDENLGIGLGFLINQQYEQDGTPLNARENVGGVPLIFTREVEQPEYIAPEDNDDLETSGTRMTKYHPNEEGGDRRTHVLRYRFGDAFLMKAEAMWRMGGDPTVMINDLRTTRGASVLGTVEEADLLAERGREMYQELTRRQDLIRFGQYLRAWNLKEAGSDHLKIFPIPLADALGNPNLVQNPGY